jgi:CRISPR-associated protein Cmr5
VENSKIESGRAEFALAEVKEALRDGTLKQSEYKSYCKKFPSMVQANGLAAAVAFINEKNGTYKYLYDHTEKWLRVRGHCPQDTNLLEYACSLESAQYRVVTKEVLALFNWIRRFASGLIEGEE